MNKELARYYYPFAVALGGVVGLFVAVVALAVLVHLAVFLFGVEWTNEGRGIATTFVLLASMGGGLGGAFAVGVWLDE